MSSDIIREWVRLACVCLGVSREGVGQQWPGQQWPVEGSRELTTTVLGGLACWHKSFWRRSPYCRLASWGENTAPPISTKIGLKTYWAWPCPPEQDPTLPKPVPPIRKLPQTSCLHPSEGRQSENHNHRKLTKLITQIMALSNSMKLWAMPCRATQEGWVMVESYDKTWSTGEENGKPL